MATNSRLSPCPNCEEPISKRATECPHCDHVFRRVAHKTRIIPWLTITVILLGLIGAAYTAGWCGGPGTDPIKDVVVSPDDWPWWRGPSYNNIAEGEPPATHWSQDENIVWKTPVPGLGHGSPIVAGKRIFLLTADDLKETMSLVCFYRESGQLLWETELHRGGLMHKSLKNSYASSTPACDGQRVFATFITRGGLWLTATDLDGEILWQKLVAPFQSEHGYASCPLIYRSLVIVAGDNLEPSFLTALDRRTGETVWQVPRHQGGSYGSPVVATLAGNEQLLLSGQGFVTSYNPSDGQTLWSSQAMSPSMIGTIAWHNDFVFATSLHGTVCIRADGVGDVSHSHVAWASRVKANVPSPLVVEDRLIVVQDDGIVSCLSVRSGEQHWKKRLGGNISASPVLAGEYVYVPNEEGRTFVFKAAADFELVAENDLGDSSFASPVICGGRIYLRTEQHLFCIGKTKAAIEN